MGVYVEDASDMGHGSFQMAHLGWCHRKCPEEQESIDSQDVQLGI